MHMLVAKCVCVCESVCVFVVVVFSMCVFTNVQMSLRQTIECEQNFHQVTTKNIFFLNNGFVCLCPFWLWHGSGTVVKK